MKIITILGARPQFIKAATVSRGIAENNQLHPNDFITEVIIHTGQHYDEMMSDVFFNELEIPKPKYNLTVGSGAHGVQTGKMLQGIEAILTEEKPDLVLVYGDTNSTLAGGLAASKLMIPIIHVEAGLRSFNRKMPEEVNRVLTDHLSTLLLCPTQTAVNNLKNEGICEGVIVVGDVMYDATVDASSRIADGVLNRFGFEKKSYYMMTVHRAENTDNKTNLVNILNAMAKLDMPVIWPIHPRTKNILEKLNVAMPENITVCEPLGYFENISLLTHSKCLVTDSGGMQKEAYWVGVPCVTLRDDTEWVETVKHGWNTLAGTNECNIVKAVQLASAKRSRPEILGTLGASKRVVSELVKIKNLK